MPPSNRTDSTSFGAHRQELALQAWLAAVEELGLPSKTPDLLVHLMRYYGTDRPLVEALPDAYSRLDPALRDGLSLSESAKGIRVVYGLRGTHAALEEYVVVLGVVPDRVAHQFYPTLASVADVVIEAADLRDGLTCLEPSAGFGALARRLPVASTTCVEMGDPVIASVSLGASRRFKLRRKPSARAAARAARLAGSPWASPDNLEVTLEHGSLLVMLRGVQAEWEHSLPKAFGVLDERLNLTFRDCVSPSVRVTLPPRRA